MRYKYAFIDAQILLTTGVYAIQSQYKDGKIQQNELLRMFILSVFKIIREVQCERPYLVWDSSPYHKNAILKQLLGQDDYKGDRGYKTEDDITKANNEISKLEERISKLQAEDPLLHEAEIAELNDQIAKFRKQINNIEVQIHNFKVRSETKYFIIDKLQNFGITSIIKKGWEADDIITLLADYCNENKTKAVLVSKDSDYDFMLNPYVDKYNQLCRKAPTETDPNPKLTTYDKVISYWWWIPRDFPDKKLFEVKALMDSTWGSHNFLHRTVKPEWCKEGVYLIDALNHGEDAFNDYKLFQAQLETFNFKNYPDYEFIANCLPWYSKKGKLDTVENFSKFISENNVRMNPMGYRKIIEILNYELYDSD